MSENPYASVRRVLEIEEVYRVNALLPIGLGPGFRAFTLLGVAKRRFEDGDERFVYSVGQTMKVCCPRHENSLISGSEVTVSQHSSGGIMGLSVHCPECGEIKITELQAVSQ